MTERLHRQTKELLALLRARRGFDPERYVAAKVRLLNDYMRRSGLSATVVGLSGGVDSAVVQGIISRAAREPGSPIKRMVGAFLPYFIKEGTTNQESATARGREVAEAFGAEPRLVDLSAAHDALRAATDKAMGVESDAWASGQLVTYLRQSDLYFLTSKLIQDGFSAILVGTTNRDEGAYIGFFAKAGDAMVDLQLISDIHKSEVYAVAKLLGVPKSVMDAAPAGDVYDGRDDEQLIGLRYDFIELYQLLLCLPGAEQKRLVDGLGKTARAQFARLSARIQQLYNQNSHKYLGGSQAVHMDVYERPVPGGWRDDLRTVADRAVDQGVFVNKFELKPSVIDRLAAPKTRIVRKDIADFGETGFVIDGLLSAQECKRIARELQRQELVPANRNGMAKDYDPKRDQVGSWRASYFSQAFAERLWNRLAPLLPMVRFADGSGPSTDWGDYPIWRAVGINPLMRFIKYTSGGLLVPHYDAPYDAREGKRTLMSLVLYLTNNKSEDGGATRFIKDPLRDVPLDKRDLNDWKRLANADEVIARVVPKAGSALVFDHRMLHDGEALRNGVKIIMRTDIVFERCGLPKAANVTVSKPLGLL